VAVAPIIPRPARGACLIRAVNGAHNGLLDLEELTEKDLERIKARYEALALKAREDLERGLKDTEPAEVQTD
jgi:low affinity Fe/Cu permease